ncbi:hypothetical protein [Catellatospora vulcania]|uniref:hypothetical protein n=1 Tax=Catellatospora vulcania TaxID=1460450 RepID=UPI0012D385DC|nr:hypothetical protein [Catellatospora vulcania]
MSTGPVPAAPGKGTARLALLVAAVSLVVALVAAGVAGVALVRSGDESPDTVAAPGDGASAQATAGGDAPAAPATTAAAAEPSPTGTVLGVLSPQAVYTQVYKDQELIPQVTRGASAYLDLNEPRVVQQGSDKDDARLELPYNSTVPVIILLDGVEGAVVPENIKDPQPEDCADLIRKSPVPPRAETAAQRELIMCVATSQEQAAAIGQRQRMVVLHVIALSSNAKVSIQLKAWEAPS